MAISRIIFIAF